MAGVLGILLWGGHSRAEAPPGRYTVTALGTIAGGTVLDTKTGLTWQRQAPETYYTWADATSYCPTLGAGWRLPSVKELMTLVDYSKLFPDPAIDTTAFTNAPGGNFWTSSLYAGFPSFGWNVGFDGGSASFGGVTSLSRARCVH